MTESKVDLPSLVMVLSFTSNLVFGLFDPYKIPVPKEIGIALVICGSLFFIYVIYYLRSGFFGETEPKLNILITEGPYKLCRHPQYLSFLVMVLGFDLAFRSIIGIVFTFALSLPSIVYRAKKEDTALRNKFGEEWEKYAAEVGFLFPKL